MSTGIGGRGATMSDGQAEEAGSSHLESSLQVVEDRILGKCWQGDHVVVTKTRDLGEECGWITILPRLERSDLESWHASDAT